MLNPLTLKKYTEALEKGKNRRKSKRTMINKQNFL